MTQDQLIPFVDLVTILVVCLSHEVSGGVIDHDPTVGGMEFENPSCHLFCFRRMSLVKRHHVAIGATRSKAGVEDWEDRGVNVDMVRERCIRGGGQEFSSGDR